MYLKDNKVILPFSYDKTYFYLDVISSLQLIVFILMSLEKCSISVYINNGFKLRKNK